MKYTIVLIVFWLVQLDVLGQAHYILRFFRSNNEITVKATKVGENRLSNRSFKSQDFHNKVKNSAGLVLKINQSEYNQLFKTIQSDKILEDKLERLLHFKLQNRKSIRGKLNAPGSLNHENFPNRPPSPKLINKYSKYNQLDVYVSIPENEKEYTQFFGMQNSAHLQQMKKLQDQLEKADNDNIYFATSATDFLSGIHQYLKEKPMVLIGLNEEGWYKFPDGSAMALSKIEHIVPANNNYPIIYFNCKHTEKQGAETKSPIISLSEAMDIALGINDELNKPKEKKDLKPAYNASLEMVNQNKNLTITYKTFATGSGPFMVYEINIKK